MSVLRCWCGREYLIYDEDNVCDCGYHVYEDLVDEIEQLKKANENLVGLGYMELHEEIKRLNKKIITKDETIDRLDNQRQNNEFEIDRLRQLLDATAGDSEIKDEEIERLKKEVKGLEMALAGYSSYHIRKELEGKS